jgi:hypothetical protein
MLREGKLRALSGMTIDKWEAHQKGASRAREQKRWSSTKRGIGHSSPFRVLVAPVIDRTPRLVGRNTGGNHRKTRHDPGQILQSDDRFPNTDLESK